MKTLTRFLFECSPWGPEWSALLAGYAVIGLDGRLYLTDEGAEYLESIDG